MQRFPASGAILPVLILPLLWSSSTVAQPVAGSRALIVVRVPSSAKVLIDGVPTRRTGATRRFISPRLTAGKQYYYTLTAIWTENGIEKKTSRKVPIQAGQEVNVDLRTVAAVPKAEPAPKVELKLPANPSSKPKTRVFLFTYSATISGLPADKTASIWLPMPTRNEEQDIEIVEEAGIPADIRVEKDKVYGNKILFMAAKPNRNGLIPFSLTYKVTRHEVRDETRAKESDDLLQRYLKPDINVPITGKPLELLQGTKLPASQFDAGRALYRLVDNHMKYSKNGKGWGKGDAVWACQSGYGNCTDFHSLFISLARSQKIPAKFEIGFPLPPERGQGAVNGYHCWAKFKPEGKGWIAVDISEADKSPKMKDYFFGNITENRVAFTQGRDIVLTPKQAGEPLNYFIYPYVEVDGKPLPARGLKMKFTYKDTGE